MNDTSTTLYSLTLRQVRGDIIDELYDLKFITGRPIYSLVEEAIDVWLTREMRPIYKVYLEAAREQRLLAHIETGSDEQLAIQQEPSVPNSNSQ
jgi:hypothetical protein